MATKEELTTGSASAATEHTEESQYPLLTSSAADLAMKAATERLCSLIEEVLFDPQREGGESEAPATPQDKLRADRLEKKTIERCRHDLQMWMRNAKDWMELVPDCGHERCASRKTHFDAQDIYNDCVNVLALMEASTQDEAALAGEDMCPLIHHKMVLCYAGFARDMLHGCTQPGFERPGKGKRLLAQIKATHRSAKRKRKASKASKPRDKTPSL